MGKHPITIYKVDKHVNRSLLALIFMPEKRSIYEQYRKIQIWRSSYISIAKLLAIDRQLTGIPGPPFS